MSICPLATGELSLQKETLFVHWNMEPELFQQASIQKRKRSRKQSKFSMGTISWDQENSYAPDASHPSSFTHCLFPFRQAVFSFCCMFKTPLLYTRSLDKVFGDSYSVLLLIFLLEVKQLPTPTLSSPGFSPSLRARSTGH